MYRARTYAGDHLIPAEETEERFEREKQARLRRFTQGAKALDRASGGMSSYAMETTENTEPVRGGQLINSDDLDARFAALNSRYSE